MSYNGYRNRATWGVALIFGNDYGYYQLSRDWVEACARKGMTKAQAKERLAELIENEVDHEWDGASVAVSRVGPIASQLLPSLGSMEIDYGEVAEGMLEDYSDLRKEYASSSARPKSAPRSGASKSKAPAKKTPAKSSKPKAEGRRRPWPRVPSA